MERALPSSYTNRAMTPTKYIPMIMAIVFIDVWSLGLYYIIKVLIVHLGDSLNGHVIALTGKLLSVYMGLR